MRGGALIPSLVLGLGLAACGGGSGGDEPTGAGRGRADDGAEAAAPAAESPVAPAAEGPVTVADWTAEVERFAALAAGPLADALASDLDRLGRLSDDGASDDGARAAALEAVARRLDAHAVFELAEGGYRLALARRPDDARLRFHHARTLYETARLEAAVDELERAVELAPERAPGWWRLGLWRSELGRFEPAEAAFRRALELDPDDPSAIVGLARLELDDGRARQALERLDALLERVPLLHAAHLADRARRALGLPPRLPADQVVAPHPWSDPWIDELAELRVGHGEELAEVLDLIRAGRTDDALTALEPLLDERPDDTNVQGMYAAACARAGRPEAALELLREAAARRPRHYRIALNLSINLAAAGRLEEALVEARRAVELHPGHALARFQQGRLAQRLGARDEAREAYEAALALGCPPERVRPGLEALAREEEGR